MKRTNQAFTLIELLISLSIAFILFGYAIPSFSELIDSKKISAKVQRLNQALQLSRSKAITNNVKVTICPINGELHCSSDWSTGYMSFIDLNGNRSYDQDDTLLDQYKDTDKDITLTWRAFGARKSLQWLETGITNHQNGSFEFCYKNKADKSRALFITKAGRVRFSKDTNGDHIHENSTGGTINC